MESVKIPTFYEQTIVIPSLFCLHSYFLKNHHPEWSIYLKCISCNSVPAACFSSKGFAIKGNSKGHHQCAGKIGTYWIDIVYLSGNLENTFMLTETKIYYGIKWKYIITSNAWQTILNSSSRPFFEYAFFSLFLSLG